MMAKNSLAAFLALLLFSCSSDPYPPIMETPTYAYRHGEVIWHELATADLASSREFYRELFHWEFTEYSTDGNSYLLVKNEGKYIGGMVSVPDGNQSTWISAISVEDTEAAVETALRQGGDVLVKATRINGRGSMALVKDPQGALVSFIHSSIGDPVIEEVNSFEWLWTELWSDEPNASSEYYASVFPYTVNQTAIDEKPYWVLNQNDRRIAGIINNPIDNMSSQWVPYIKVVDPAYMVSKAKKLGAIVLLQPSEDIRNGSVAVLADPNGAIFCLQKWPLN